MVGNIFDVVWGLLGACETHVVIRMRLVSQTVTAHFREKIKAIGKTLPQLLMPLPGSLFLQFCDFLIVVLANMDSTSFDYPSMISLEASEQVLKKKQTKII